jgi:hypothetical protein
VPEVFGINRGAGHAEAEELQDAGLGQASIREAGENEGLGSR